MRIDSLLTFKFQFPGSNSKRGALIIYFQKRLKVKLLAHSTGAMQCRECEVETLGNIIPCWVTLTFILYSVVSVIRVTITRHISDILATQSATDSRLGSRRRVNTIS